MEIPETDNGGLEHLAPLDEDTIPDANQSHYCFSCKAPMTAVYCGACGQRNDDCRRSIFALIREAIGSMFGLESRIWRTWLALLFRPGKVAREFADGSRTKWSSPVRVYLAMSIILFGYMGCTGTQIFSIDVEPSIADSGAGKTTEELLPGDINLSFDVLFFITQADVDKRNETRDFSLIEKKVSEGLGINLNLGDDSEASITEDAQTELEEEEQSFNIQDMSGEDINVSGQQASNFIVHAIRNPEVLNNSIFIWLPRFMFFMMPFTMLIGAIFIRGKRALLYDHLVHAAYIHAVTFLLILIGVLISRVLHSAVIAEVIMIIVLIYLPLSLKRMFGRGWFKTIFASYSVGLIYMLMLSVMMSSAVSINIIQQISSLGA